MICPICNNKTDKLRAIIRNDSVVTGCDGCVSSSKVQGDSGKYEREYQKIKYRKDIVQHIEPDYVKAVGIDKAREAGWSDENIRKYL